MATVLNGIGASVQYESYLSYVLSVSVSVPVSVRVNAPLNLCASNLPEPWMPPAQKSWRWSPRQDVWTAACEALVSGMCCRSSVTHRGQDICNIQFILITKKQAKHYLMSSLCKCSRSIHT